MKSLRMRLVTGLSALLAAGLGCFALLFYVATSRWLEPDSLAMARDKTIRLGRWVTATNLTFDVKLYENIRNEAQGYHWAVMDSKGQLLQPSRLLPAFFPIPERVRSQYGQLSDAYAEIRQDTNGARYAVAWYPVFYVTNYGDGIDRAHVTGWTEAVVPLESFERRRSALRRWLWSAGILVLGGFSFLAWQLSGLWLRSLRAAANTAADAVRSDFSQLRLAVPEDDAEVATLAKSFNQLLDRLRETHAHQQQFIADASHELRTPLAALRAEMDVTLRRERDGPEYQRVLHGCREELLRVTRLVESLLVLARSDRPGATLQREPLDLASLCRDVCEQLQPMAKERRVHLQLEVPDELPYSGDGSALHGVVRNLVENALQHTPAEDRVFVRARANCDNIEMEIEDEGVGIAPEHLPRLFDRFYRVDTARSRASGGAGLGLSIVKALVEAHGGRVEARSQLGKGSVFKVRLPKI
jgi:heavy metal sensor kinase